MDEQFVELAWPEPEIAMITITREQSLNALNPVVLDQLEARLNEAEGLPAAKVGIVTGQGSKAFVAGADISVIHHVSDATQARAFAERGQALFQRFAESRIIFIAAINGYALGGGLELAMALDFRIASETARLGQPEINLGIVPGFGGTQRLSRLIGPGHALWMIASGEPLTARTGETLGLIEAVVEPAALMEEALKRARILAAKAPLALRECKRLVAASRDSSLPGGLAIEADAFARLAVSDDGREGTRAFLEKRKPEFRGS